eukprot:TRINITY_DN4556_c0_g1_i1.p1 TRINITY_DN4556_c0_g1~~TRINITY_DN4556_c0_g1_i1.p1  ORF type:complete len:273 (+),score=39.03 TRINITY_DN4556_c0_g1_i1:56-874(+)
MSISLFGEVFPYFLFGILYAILFIVCIIQIIRSISILRKTFTQFHLIHYLVVLDSAIRATYFFIQIYFTGSDSPILNTLIKIFFELPGFLSFSLFTFFLLMWIQKCYSNRDPRFNDSVSQYIFQSYYVYGNVFVYCVQIIIWIMGALFPWLNESFDMLSNIFFIAISIFAAVMFIIVGSKILEWHNSINILSAQSISSKHRTLTTVVVSFFICFVLRAVLVGLTIFNKRFTFDITITVIYVLFGDFIPNVLAILVSGKIPSRSNRSINYEAI